MLAFSNQKILAGIVVGGFLLLGITQLAAVAMAASGVDTDTASLPLTSGVNTDTASLNNTSGGGTVPQLGPKGLTDLITRVADFLITLAIPFAVLMIIWAGFLFVTAQGDTSKIEKARKNLLYTVIGVLVILASKVLVVYIQESLNGGGSRASSLFDKVKDTLNSVIELLFVITTVYFFWGIVKYIGAAGNEEAIKIGKRHMIWGLIGMALMVGAWEVVNLIGDYVM